MRDAMYLQKSSSIHNASAYHAVMDSLKQLEFDTIVDIGCGRGDFLVKAYETFPDKKIMGIEIDERTVDIAAGVLSRNRALNDISIIRGDAAYPTEWVNKLGIQNASRCAIVGITIWHEFLNQQEMLPAILKRYRVCFPGSFFLMAEFNGISADDFSRFPENFKGMASFYQLVHPLSNQGVPPPVSTWQAFFKDNGVSVVGVIPTKNNMTTYIGVLTPLGLSS